MRLCVARRNPLQAPLSPVGLMTSLNPCLVLGGQPTYDIVRGWDAAAFFSSLLGELDLLPGFMVETLEQGVCQLCGNQSQQVFSPLIYNPGNGMAFRVSFSSRHPHVFTLR